MYETAQKCENSAIFNQKYALKLLIDLAVSSKGEFWIF